MPSRKGKPNITPEQERMILQQVSMGAYPSQAALKVGVSPSTVSMRKKRDADFARRLLESEAAAEFGMYAEVRLSKEPRLILELMARRWPERWARPEIRAELAMTNVDPDEITKAFHAGMALIAQRWAPRDAVDEDDRPMPDAAGAREPEPPPGGVSRS